MNEISMPWHIRNVMEKLMQRGTAAVSTLSLLLIGSLIAGCGSSGGGGEAGVSSQTVSGVAATGSPLVGQVTLRDSSSARRDKSTVIAGDGSFAIDVSDMTGPFLLKATGTADGVSRTLFSFADKPGIANINPLSGVALAHAAGVDDPETVFDQSDAVMLDRIKSGIPGSVSTLKAKLNLLLDDFGVANADPIKDPFTADHTGLDGVFDNVRIVIASGTLTITNATTGAVIFTAQVRDIASGNFSDRDDDRPKPGIRPAAPGNVIAVGGDGQISVSWDAVANATSYDLFYTSKPNVAKEEDEDDAGDDDHKHSKRVKNVTSPFVLTGLAASTTYSIIVRAINNGRRGPASAKVSATTSATTPVPTIPAAPTGVSATGGTKQATVSWTAVSGATTYNLYWSTTTGVTTANGTKISDIANPPAVHAGLTDSTTYFYIVTAVNGAGESAASAQAQATTLAAGQTTTTTAASTTTTTAGATTSTTAGGATSTTAASTTTSTAPTTTTTTSTTTTTLAPALDGVALFAANCSGCHGVNGKRPRTAAQITAAIANEGDMQGISLTQAQIAAIATARP
jgi:hypothetical protein